MSNTPLPPVECDARFSGWWNCVFVHLVVLMGFALVLNREGTWVPAGNENIYLLYLMKAWQAGFLKTDWTFQESTAGHPVFNFLFGWPTRLMSLEVFGWIGRVASWGVLFAALLRIGRHFRIPPWLGASAILLWLIQRQSFVANEWIIGTFEAKCVGYACLLFAIDLILSGKLVPAAILTGLAFTFHSAVGLWGGAAIGLAVATQYPMRKTLMFAMWAGLFALPGVVTSWKLIGGGHPITPEEAKFLVTIEMPFHLDPLTFGKGKIAVLYLMLLCNVLHYWSNRNDEKLGFLIRFEIFSGAFFLLGIILRVMGKFTLVELFPFRVFAVLIMLMFFWHLAAAIWHWGDRTGLTNGERRRLGRPTASAPPAAAYMALSLFTFFCLPSPVARLQGLAADQLPKWKHHDDDFVTAANWVRANSTEGQIVIAPPWRKDTFYRLQRPLIADWHVPRFDGMTEWRERIEVLVGDVSHTSVDDNLAGELDDRARNFYAHLTENDLAEIRRKYGGDLLVTPATYSYPLLFSAGDYRVYRLGGKRPGD